MTPAEYVRYILIYMAGLVLISILFFNSLIPMIFLSPAIIVLLKNKRVALKEKRQKTLRLEFKELMVSLAANMSAGYSLEKSMINSYDEMNSLFGDKCYMCQEILWMKKGLDMNVDPVELFADLGDRSGVFEIVEFAQVVSVGKKSGGDTIRIIKRMTDNITRKGDIENEIDTMVSGKRLEQRIMCLMPFGIIMYLRLTNETYISGLYGNFVGIVVMSVALLLIYAAYIWGSRLVKIEV